MSTRKLGYLLTTVGVSVFLVSLLVGYFGLGDTRLGASQLLGMEVGIVTLVTGISLAFLYTDRQIEFWNSLRGGMNRILNLPVGVWVMLGFLIVYAFFFLSPVFLNSERSMWYFNRFLPDKMPIGLDIRAVMDYIQAWLTSNQSPYADGFIAYPPLALVLLSPLLLIGYPAYYFLITFTSVLFYVASTLLVPLFSNLGKNNSLPLLLFILGLFSYGFQFELERGQTNIIAFSLCLIAVYLFHASENHRYPAYLLFTLGVQIKIYPAILIVMFIKNWRDWKSNVKRIAGIMFLNFALLFILGLGIFSDFLHSVKGQQVYGGTWNGNHSLRGFVDHLAMDGFGLVGSGTLSTLQEYRGLLEIALLAALGICLLSVLIRSQLQSPSGLNANLLVLCTICALVIPSVSNDYKLPILTAPMAMLWCNIPTPEGSFKQRLMSVFLILITSVAYWSIQYPFVVKPYFLTRNFPALFVLLLAVTALSFAASSEPETMAHGSTAK